MSLLTNAMEECIMMDKRTVSDGRGSVTPTWVEGAEFEAAIAFDGSLQARAAQAAGVTSLYNVMTRKNVNLEYHDVFKRVSDGKIFRVTSDGDDFKTPESAALNARQVSAEEWALTDYHG